MLLTKKELWNIFILRLSPEIDQVIVSFDGVNIF